MPEDKAERRLLIQLTHAAAFCELSCKLNVQTVKKQKKYCTGIFSSDCSSFPVRRMPQLLMSEQRCKQGFFLSATSSPLSSILTDRASEWYPVEDIGKKKPKVQSISCISGTFNKTAAHFIHDWAFRLIGLSEKKKNPSKMIKKALWVRMQVLCRVYKNF